MSVTTIEWTKRPGTIGETWNPTTGCNKVDRGCKHCYAEVMHRRLQAMGQKKYEQDFLKGAVCHPDTLTIPLGWSKPRTVFVDSMSDLFHKDVPFDFIRKVFEAMAGTPWHTYLILTKRPERALEFWKWMANDVAIDVIPGGLSVERWRCPSNVWMGTSVNDQTSANKRVPLLLQLDRVLRFISYEPATGPVDLRAVHEDLFHDTIDALQGVSRFACDVNRDHPRVHWVIMGGESGHGAEPMHPAWVRKVREDCKATGTPFFFKQWGAWRPHTFRKEDQTIYIKFQLGKDEFLFPDPAQNMKRVGKGEAGNQLDGETYQQFPQP